MPLTQIKSNTVKCSTSDKVRIRTPQSGKEPLQGREVMGKGMGQSQAIQFRGHNVKGS